MMPSDMMPVSQIFTLKFYGVKFNPHHAYRFLSRKCCLLITSATQDLFYHGNKHYEP